jgi:prepilin peptidase CpaA
MFIGSTTSMAWGAAFTLLLAVGCVTDVRSRRIPNELNALNLLGGLTYGFTTGGLPGIVSSLAGMALGFAIWIAFYALGAMGAGDVKFFAAAGAWLGPAATWRAALIAALAGGLLAMLFLLRERRLGSAMRGIALAASSRSLAVVGNADTAARQKHLPYGVALALGALAMAWLPSPL